MHIERLSKTLRVFRRLNFCTAELSQVRRYVQVGAGVTEGVAREVKKALYRKARLRQLELGDKVLILLPTDSHKLLMQWKGPFEVVERVSE